MAVKRGGNKKPKYNRERKFVDRFIHISLNNWNGFIYISGYNSVNHKNTTMKVLITLLIIPFLTILMDKDKETSLYDFKQTAIRGGEIEMSQYKGQVLLIVNTASKCGYTPQYEALQALQEKYGDTGFTVLAFPANNFAGQEPGSDEEIEEFCTVNFNTTFPLFSRTSVKGDDINPMFNYLTSAENEDFTGEIRWNFEKFLIDRSGNLVRRFRSNVAPDSQEVVGAIEKELN